MAVQGSYGISLRGENFLEKRSCFSKWLTSANIKSLTGKYQWTSVESEINGKIESISKCKFESYVYIEFERTGCTFSGTVHTNSDVIKEGKLTYPNGTVYEGGFDAEGYPSGKGKLTLFGNYRYIFNGIFEKGLSNGEMIFENCYEPNSSVKFKGTFMNGAPHQGILISFGTHHEVMNGLEDPRKSYLHKWNVGQVLCTTQESGHFVVQQKSHLGDVEFKIVGKAKIEFETSGVKLEGSFESDSHRVDGTLTYSRNARSREFKGLLHVEWKHDRHKGNFYALSALHGSRTISLSLVTGSTLQGDTITGSFVNDRPDGEVIISNPGRGYNLRGVYKNGSPISIFNRIERSTVTYASQNTPQQVLQGRDSNAENQNGVTYERNFLDGQAVAKVVVEKENEELKTAQQEIVDLNATIKEKEQQIERLKQSQSAQVTSEYQEQIKQLTEEIKSYQEIITELENELEKIRTEKRELQNLSLNKIAGTQHVPKPFNQPKSSVTQIVNNIIRK